MTFDKEKFQRLRKILIEEDDEGVDTDVDLSSDAPSVFRKNDLKRGEPASPEQSTRYKAAFMPPKR